ncbi:thioredoxin-disulfide reductase, partial [Paenibacillus sp. PsM32]|nr:thioredoxin-disulfide reductase [Paenibacillus sp. PsM32]
WVNSVDLGDRPFKLKVEGMGDLVTDTLSISTGATANYLGIHNEKFNIGRGLSPGAPCEGCFYRVKEIVVGVVGAG